MAGEGTAAGKRTRDVEASTSRGRRKAQRADILAHVESMGHRGESQHRNLSTRWTNDCCGVWRSDEEGLFVGDDGWR